MLTRERIRILPADRVRPHEVADPGREERIERRLLADGLLRDPVIVGALQDLDDYVLLDGTNRMRALANLRMPWLMAQVIDYADPHQVQLRTWCHSAEPSVSVLLDGSRAIPGIEALELPPLEATGALSRSETLALLLAPETAYALQRRGQPQPSRAEQLCRLVDLYEPTLTRVDCDPEDVEAQARALGANAGRARSLVAFPSFSRSQVVTMALRGTLIPAGITRHVVLVGRALRVNLPLDVLEGRADLAIANERLQEHLRGLSPRLYREPTILFDS